MSVFSWDGLFRLCEVVSIAAGAIAVAALIGQVVAGRVLSDRQAVEIERLKLDVANQQERAANAEIELEQLKKQIGPRQIKRDAFLKALEGQPKAPVQILYLKDDPDSLEFAQEIENLFIKANWRVTSREPIPTPKKAKKGQEVPTTMSVGGQPSGVTVVARSISEEESSASLNRIEGKPWVRTPWTVLDNAFLEGMGQGSASSNDTVPKGTLRVVVGPKFVR